MATDTLLFRATYTRRGSVGGMTFAVPGGLFAAEAAARFAETVVMTYARALDERAQLLTVKEVKK